MVIRPSGLRASRKTPTLEVTNFEDGCPGFCCRTLQLGTVYLREAPRIKILPEEGANG